MVELIRELPGGELCGFVGEDESEGGPRGSWGSSGMYMAMGIVVEGEEMKSYVRDIQNQASQEMEAPGERNSESDRTF